jgi:predicted phosphodiesterase
VKLLIFSDLHLEFLPLVPADSEADVVVLAGDIDLGVRGISWGRRSFPGQEVVYVAGNHEFYGHDWDVLLDDLREEARRQRVYFLENDAVDINGVRFLGTALWTDFDFFGADRRAEAMRVAQEYMTDYVRISVSRPQTGFEQLNGKLRTVGQSLLVPELVRARHLASRSWLQARFGESTDKKTIVVTHSLPSGQSVAERFKQDLTSASFASNLDSLMGNAALWVHGHTHDSFDYTLNGTRVVCNPRGYCEFSRSGMECENQLFDPKKMVEI